MTSYFHYIHETKKIQKDDFLNLCCSKLNLLAIARDRTTHNILIQLPLQCVLLQQTQDKSFCSLLYQVNQISSQSESALMVAINALNSALNK